MSITTAHASRRGIHDENDVRDRCEIEGEHWIWQGYTLDGRPMARVRGEVVQGIRITAVAMGRDGKRKSHQRWYAGCGDALCMSPACMKRGTHRQALRAASRAGRLKRDAAAMAHNRAARAARPDVRPDWMVQWALESPQPATHVAHALGVDRSTVGVWRRAGKRKALVAGPFSQLLEVTT